VVVVAAAVVAGLVAPTEARAVVLLPAAIALGLAVVALAVTRFELFVASILLVRASLDAADLGPTALDAAGAISVLFVGASAIWLLAQRSEEAVPSPTAPLIPPVATLFGCSLLSVTVSAHPLDSLFEVVRFGTLIVIVAVLGRLVRSGRALRLVLIAAIGSSIVPILFAIRQITGQGGVITASGLDRVRGTFLHSNPFAAYLFLMITLIVSVYPHVERRWRLVLVPLALACGGCLIATYSRGAWIATVVALVVIGIVQDRRILWLLGGLIVVVALAVPSVGVRLSDLSETQKETGAPGNSLIWRLEYWREVLALQDNPVIGIGFKEVELSQTGAKSPHNDPIRIFVETGIVGFAAYVWLLITLGAQARSTLRRAPPGLPRGLAVAFAASFSGLLLLSLTANVITQLVILWYFVTIVALAMVWAPPLRLAPAPDVARA
jgi:O-antigen ligase